MSEAKQPVIDKYNEYLKQAKHATELGTLLLQNLDAIFAASVNLQHFIGTRMPECGNEGTRIIRATFKPYRSGVTMHLIISVWHTSMSSFSIGLVKELEKAVLDTAYAAKLIVVSKDKFEEKYPEMYPAVEPTRYDLYQAILKAILT
jgi:hypothetical protein